MRIAILLTTVDPSDFALRHPDDAGKLRALLGPFRPNWRFETFAVRDGVFAPDPLAFDATIITGSPASVHDPAPWIGRLMALIRDLHAARHPMLGVCFGHQAIAQALGGQVGPNPGRFVLGVETTEICALAPWMQPPWMQPPRDALSLYAAHGEQVTALPPEAVVLSRSADCPVGMFSIGTHILATEYHPEMYPAFMAGLARLLDGKLPEPVLARARAEAGLPTDGPVFAQWAIRFFEAARTAD
ncbi:MAG: type 1 glutamine amidotransferase [Pseudomonadota bacterium]